MRAVYGNMTFASSSSRPFTILTEDDGIPGSKFEREPENYTVEQLKRWLKCRGLKQSGKREELLRRARDCIKSGNHRTLDSSIDGKWFAAKSVKENSEFKGNYTVLSTPVIPTSGWRTFPSQDIPALFNYAMCIITRWSQSKMSTTPTIKRKDLVI